ncbi:MAG: CPBP family glutamic-type intramembrane protease [Leptolyngbyaceae cyanobacterium bins.302]|nr:CPBP family glutamic-type intramembrane protease [Leptolyngbyaceae cyanobacterium bins.302]
MTIKRLILVVLTIFAIALMGQDLLSSWNQPQIQSRLELYQTNLLLQATEVRSTDETLTTAARTLAGEDPLQAALKQYQDVRDQAQQNLAKSQKLLDTDAVQRDPVEVKRLEDTNHKLAQLMTELDLNLGILNAQQGDVDAALKTWTIASQQVTEQNLPTQLAATANVLTGLWSRPPQLLPEAESALRKNLEGWFENRALAQLYELQQRQDALQELKLTQQQVAEQAFQNLIIIAGVPVLGCVIGVGILLFLIGQWLVQRKQALLSAASMSGWTTPWDGEIVWQVLIVGFFLVGQVVLPIAFGILRQTPIFAVFGGSEGGKALLILINYLSLAAGGLGVLYVSLKPFFPLPEGWFRVQLRGNWFWWGLGGYFAALPLVILISLLNQQIWQGQGGSNPILPIALEERDNVALILFFVTAAIAAPIFEEILFRGFLLPSLTRYMPIWGAIALSSLIFAVAHLSLSEVLPLTVLGMVLGFVYARSRNLLASMLLHGLWNTGTLASLIILGGGQG